VESDLFSNLVLAAFVLLAGLTAGIVYLTFTEWRDRRLRDNDAKAGSFRSSNSLNSQVSRKADKKQRREQAKEQAKGNTKGKK
jgi:hypothetical protein